MDFSPLCFGYNWNLAFDDKKNYAFCGEIEELLAEFKRLFGEALLVTKLLLENISYFVSSSRGELIIYSYGAEFV